METFKLLRSSHAHFIRPHHGLLTLFTSSAIFFFVHSWIFLLFFRLLKSSVVVYGTFFLFCDDAFILFLIALYYYAVCVISLSARQSPMKEQPAPKLPHK